MAVVVLDIDRENEFSLAWGGEPTAIHIMEPAADWACSHLVWAVRAAARKGKDLIITREACARLSIDTPDPYDEAGDPVFGVLAG